MDGMQMGDGATLERADRLAGQFRDEVGIGAVRALRADGDGAEMRKVNVSGLRGFQLDDVDGLLRRHEEAAYHQGYNLGSDETFHRCREQHQLELGQYVGGAFSIVESEVLAAIVGAAAKARDNRRATKADVVQAVVDQVKREAAALNDMAHRARTGGLFS